MSRAMRKLIQSVTLVKGSFRNVLSGERYNSLDHLLEYSKNADSAVKFGNDLDIFDILAKLKKLLPAHVELLGFSVYDVHRYFARSKDGDEYDRAIISPDLRKVIYTDSGDDHTGVLDWEDSNIQVWANDSLYRIAAICVHENEPYIYEFTQKDVDESFSMRDTTQTETNKAVNTAGSTSANLENKQENKIMSKVTQLVELNKSAAINAGKIEAGNIALDQLVKLASKAVPSGIVGTMVKPYIDTPYGRVIIANVLAFAVQQYAPSNTKARLLVEATSNAALLELTQSLNLRKLIDELVDNPSIASVLDTLENE